MLRELYQTIDSPEEQGENIKIPGTWAKAIYLSQQGELFCYTGIYGRDKDEFYFKVGRTTWKGSTPQNATG